MQQIRDLETELRNCAYCTEENYQLCKDNLDNCPRLIKLPEGVCISAFENYIERSIGAWRYPVLAVKPWIKT